MNTGSTSSPIFEETAPSMDSTHTIQVGIESKEHLSSIPFDTAKNMRKIPQNRNSKVTEPIRTNVFDVAAYILEKCGAMSALKLQKLVYYCQAWSLVWDDEPLFPERIEAWAYGPVVKELYEFHRGLFLLSSVPIGASFKLTPTQKESIDAVIKYYGEKTPQQLIELTHLEDPWKNARKGIPVGAPSSREITLQAMQEYYASLL